MGGGDKCPCRRFWGTNAPAVGSVTKFCLHKNAGIDLIEKCPEDCHVTGEGNGVEEEGKAIQLEGSVIPIPPLTIRLRSARYNTADDDPPAPLTVITITSNCLTFSKNFVSRGQ